MRTARRSGGEVGLGALTDVYNIANSTPNIVYELLLGGILTATLVPLYVEHYEKRDQRAEDENLPLWFSGLSSADLAYMLFQVPVMVAVHAQEMVPR